MGDRLAQARRYPASSHQFVGIYQEAWEATYARNPNHIFTRKVADAINEGILVLFAAGNCGDTCPDGRCESDVGPARSIWGANGHPLVMTVGAVNSAEQFIGYSSRGPAALDPNKPDFCSVAHFTGYFPSDSGTSAATPVLAGAVALLKQAKPDLTQAEVKKVLASTAKDIGPNGFDQHSGAGIVRPAAAFEALRSREPRSVALAEPLQRQADVLDRIRAGGWVHRVGLPTARPNGIRVLAQLEAEIASLSQQLHHDADYLDRLIVVYRQLAAGLAVGTPQ